MSQKTMCSSPESQKAEIICIQIISSNSSDLLFPSMNTYQGKLESTTQFSIFHGMNCSNSSCSENEV